ncbi:MAG: alpha/beta fold hydrolase [Saprospiraceae bacterium]
MQPIINYKISGEGFPFIFQHGLGSNLAQAQSLLGGQKKVQLISMDCPGHGDTPLRLGNPPSFDFYADEVIRLMTHLNIEKAIFGGISMGAGISTNIALRYPDKVAGLVLVRPAWLDKGNPENLMILKSAGKLIGKRNARAKFEKNNEYQHIKGHLRTAAVSIMGVFNDTQQTAIPMVLKSMVSDAPFKEMTDLAKITQPCLIFGNDDDPLHPFDMAKVMHQHIKGSHLEKVTSRYVENRTHKTEVNAAVSSFITRLALAN